MGLRRNTTTTALREVVEREHPRDLPGLLAQLQGGDTEQRRWAARDLAAHPHAAPRWARGCCASRPQRARSRSSPAWPHWPATRPPPRCCRCCAARTRRCATAPSRRWPRCRSRGPAHRRPAARRRRRRAHLHRQPAGRTAPPAGAAWLLQVLQQDAQSTWWPRRIEVLAEVGGPGHADALRAGHAALPTTTSSASRSTWRSSGSRRHDRSRSLAAPCTARARREASACPGGSTSPTPTS
jgi:hypothetical protein